MTTHVANETTPSIGEQPPAAPSSAPDLKQVQSQQQKDQLALEQHTRNDDAPQEAKACDCDDPVARNPQVPGNQQHQAPGSQPINHIKQEQGLNLLNSHE